MLVVYRGAKCSIEYAVRSNGDAPARGFVEGALSSQEQRQLLVLFQRLGDMGVIANREQFKKLEGKLFEFKRHQIRVACFQVGSRWLLTNGFRKKQDRWPSQELARAHAIMNEHLLGEAESTAGGRHGG